MSEFTAPSGAIVVINPASFEAANELKKAVERELIKCGLSDLLMSALVIDSSDAVEAALWPCLNRCLYNGQKIIKSTFDNVEARKDYHAIAQACGEINIGPFVESLSSVLKKLGFLKTTKENIPASS